MTTAYVLKPSDWHRLAETGLDLAAWQAAGPANTDVVVVEQDGVLVACWATFACRHVEGFWVAPTHQKRGGVLRRLFVGMRARLAELGATTVVTQAETREVADLLRAAGATPMPGESFLLPVDFGPWAKG